MPIPAHRYELVREVERDRGSLSLGYQFERNRSDYGPASPQERSRAVAAFAELLHGCVSLPVWQRLTIECVYQDPATSSPRDLDLHTWGAHAHFFVNGQLWEIAVTTLPAPAGDIMWVVGPIPVVDYGGHKGYLEYTDSLDRTHPGEETVEKFLLKQVDLWLKWMKRRK